MNSPYGTLGVKRDDSHATIKKAYRKLSAIHHPDKGGDEEKFKTIGLAWEILKDPEKRAYYDRTGEAPGRQSDGTAEAAQIISQLFEMWEASIGLRNGFDEYEKHINVDVVGFIRKAAGEALMEASNHKEQVKAHLGRLEALAKRCKGGFAAIVASRVRAATMRMENEIEPGIADITRALEMLEDGSWEYIFEEVETYSTHGSLSEWVNRYSSGTATP